MVTVTRSPEFDQAAFREKRFSDAKRKHLRHAEDLLARDHLLLIFDL